MNDLILKIPQVQIRCDKGHESTVVLIPGYYCYKCPICQDGLTTEGIVIRYEQEYDPKIIERVETKFG